MNLVENGLMDTAGEGEGEMNWESSIDIYTVSCVKIDSQWEAAIYHRQPSLALCDNLGGGMVVG